MTADESSDLLDPRSWEKDRYPVLCSDEAAGVYGPGHNSFTVDENGDDIMVYHARTETEIVGNPLYNPNRHAMLMRLDGRMDVRCFRILIRQKKGTSHGTDM